jgi:alpha-beta hydrolase superfamily lysophospholipase
MRPLPFRYAEGWFTGSDGVRLFERLWEPEEKRATLILVHGLNDHSGRYEGVARRLAARGYAVRAFDLRGHGRSGGGRLWVGSFDEYLQDVGVFLDHVGGEYPIFLFGHSMGGAIVTLFAIARRLDVESVILSAPALKAGSGIPPALVGLTNLFDRFLPRAPVAFLNPRHLSRDSTVTESAIKDPLVSLLPPPARTGAELLRATGRIGESMEEITLPLLVMHGTADRLTDHRGSEEFYRRASSTDKTFRLYEGFYHELLNDPEADRVLSELLDWLDERL